MNKEQKQEIIKNGKLAMDHLQMAIMLLDRCDEYMNTEDFIYYRERIKELISSDNGECGLLSLIGLFEDEVKNNK